MLKDAPDAGHEETAATSPPSTTSPPSDSEEGIGEAARTSLSPPRTRSTREQAQLASIRIASMSGLDDSDHLRKAPKRSMRGRKRLVPKKQVKGRRNGGHSKKAPVETLPKTLVVKRNEAAGKKSTTPLMPVRRSTRQRSQTQKAAASNDAEDASTSVTVDTRDCTKPKKRPRAKGSVDSRDDEFASTDVGDSEKSTKTRRKANESAGTLANETSAADTVTALAKRQEALVDQIPLVPLRSTERGHMDGSAANLEDQSGICLHPLDPPPEPPPFPNTGRWSFDQQSRCIYANFKGQAVTVADKAYLGKVMERDDLTVIVEGVFPQPDPELWDLHSVGSLFDDKPYHKFRQFNRTNDHGGTTSSWEEQDGFVSMQVKEFLRYLNVLETAQSTGVPTSFEYTDASGTSHSVPNVLNVVYYMIDVDMTTHLHRLLADYVGKFKIGEILPGGAWCMLNAVPEASRPFMGPNAYLTPGGAFTQLHQDGHGTVDSGHTCLSGYNEVIMLRRLDDAHKRYACSIVPAITKTGAAFPYDALYGLPHDDNKDARPCWATVETIREWNRMGYCVSTFVLRPGQHVHINKGRLHAFRKVVFEQLPKNDAHAELRSALMKEIGEPTAPLCISVAFDWQYRGCSTEGIQRETKHSLACAELCAKNGSKSLAIPVAALLWTAKVAVLGVNSKKKSMIGFDDEESRPMISPTPRKAICRGLLSSLEDVVEKSTRTLAGDVRCRPRPDTHEDPLVYGIDPYGNDYFCKICSTELAASPYYHCNGCENLIGKDCNICEACFVAEKYMTFLQMHPTQTTILSTLNHTGRTEEEIGKRRECTCGISVCAECSLCPVCSCTCHNHFTRHQRLFSFTEMKAILANCRDVAGVSHVSEVCEGVVDHEDSEIAQTRSEVDALEGSQQELRASCEERAEAQFKGQESNSKADDTSRVTFVEYA